MGYPYDKTYLQQIRENPHTCEAIKNGYYMLCKKYAHDKHKDITEMEVRELFDILAESIELNSEIGVLVDQYHFLWDVLDALFTPEEENAEK